VASSKKKMTASGLPEHTPLMRQWLALKEQAGGLLMFFRVGDFYELFWEDAERASKLLDIVLTRRGESGGRPVVMSGVPWHALDLHMSRLVKMGVGAAVVDQIGDPAKAIGPVERAIVRIVTPGTLVDDALLSDRRDAPLLAAFPQGDQVALFWLSLSSGEARYCLRPMARLADELEWINPAEILTPDSFDVSRTGSMSCKSPLWHFDAERGASGLMAALDTPLLSSFGVDPLRDGACLAAASAAMEHAKASLGGKAPKLSRLRMIQDGSALRMDAATRKSLEIDSTLRGEDAPTLVSCLDLCSSSMGSRRLRDWIGAPLTSKADIESRHVAVESLMGQASSALGSALRGYPDTERAGARAAAMASRPRDFSNMRQAFARLPEILQTLEDARKLSPLVEQLCSQALAEPELVDFLSSAIAEEPSVHIRDGKVMAPGFSAELDDLRALSEGAQAAMDAMEARERASTGIPTLRLDFNRAHGFSIEITRTHVAKVPAHYKRKMTLKNTERYTTDELVEFETKVLSARERSLALEKGLFEAAQAKLAFHAPGIARMSLALSCLDALGGFAQAAFERGYCRPVILDGSARAQAKSLRHPVAELSLGAGFVPNDVDMDEQRRAIVVTGPNMGGKSTYMRSLALACAMAQAGSFVPAESFEITPMLDLYARVGASDDISRGQSTFMVEMTEAAAILRMAGPSSLCVIDEIGRGTSTFDGMSLAWAILRHLHDVNRSLCLFSTHYFEITDLAARLAACSNAHMAASLEAGKLRFLRKLTPGAASQSHGIDVAKLAGVPELALVWSRQMLAELEAAESALRTPSADGSLPQAKPSAEPSLNDQRALAALTECDPDSMSPKQALEALYAIKSLRDEAPKA
jgi:DNA mismatch repair protein MutS